MTQTRECIFGTEPLPTREYSRLVLLQPTVYQGHMVFMQTLDNGHLMFPGGQLQGREDCLDALRREVQEESLVSWWLAKDLMWDCLWGSNVFKFSFPKLGIDETYFVHLYSDYPGLTTVGRDAEIISGTWYSLNNLLKISNIEALYPNTRFFLQHLSGHLGEVYQLPLGIRE